MGQEVVVKVKKPFYKRVWFWIAVVVVVFVWIGASGGSEEVPTPGSADAGTAEPVKAETPKEEAPAMAKVGEEAAAGNFAFTVTKIEKTNKIGNEFLNKETEGEFLVIDLTAVNNDKEARMLDSSMFTIKDANGTEYEPDTEAALYADTDNPLFLENVNPGLPKKGKLVFELPKGLSGLILHCDSGMMFSGGKKVAIDLAV